MYYNLPENEYFLAFCPNSVQNVFMAGKRKQPRLRIDGVYYIAKIYTPDGRRTSFSFGHVDDRSEAEVREAFAKWIELYQQQPEKLLSFKDPYEAVRRILSRKQRVTVGEFLEKYVEWMEGDLRVDRNGKENPDIRKIKRARHFLTPYNDWPIEDFGPDELKAVQKCLLAHHYRSGKNIKKYTRRGVNDTVKWIRRIWEWGLGRQIVMVEQVQSLREVKNLRIGQLLSIDHSRRSRVTEEEFQKAVDSASSVVGDMLRLIWYTGMRPYEVCEMRSFDILTSDPDCWLYIPGRDKTPVGDHKTTHLGRVKVIPLTKKSQQILRSRIHDYASKDYVFRPSDALQEMRETRAMNRKTPLMQGNRPGTNKKEEPAKQPGNKYNNNTLCHACKRACVRAGIQVFVPYDLRRTVATGTRALLGKDAAKVLLGHTKTDTTDIYLLDEVQEAMKVAKLLEART